MAVLPQVEKKKFVEGAELRAHAARRGSPKWLIANVADFSAVDVSVLKLGTSLGQPKPLVLSIDSALIAACQRAGVNAKYLWEVIA
jgi:hypothetical protein